MKYLLLLLLFASCCPLQKIPKHPVKDTTTGRWIYSHDEEMIWVKDSVKTKKASHKGRLR